MLLKGESGNGEIYFEGMHNGIREITQDVSLEILALLRFPVIATNSKLATNIRNKYHLEYRKGFGWFHDYQGREIIFLEGEENIVLSFDQKVLGTIGYSILKDSVFIHQIQGVSYDRYDTRSKKQSKWYLDLQNIGWKESLLNAVEYLAKHQNKQYIYIQPSMHNPSAGGKTALRNYDDFAECQGYSIHSSIQVPFPHQEDGKWNNLTSRIIPVYGKGL